MKKKDKSTKALMYKVASMVLLLIFLFSINLFAFDIRKPESVDYFLGYGQGPLEKQDDYQFSILAVDFSYPLSSVWDFQLEPFASYVFQPDSNFEIGLAFFFKYSFFKKKVISPYIKAGSGVIYTSQDTYEQSTDFNFVDQICGGFRVIFKKLTVFLEYRHRHISNAGIKRPNSGLDSNLYLIGFSYPL